jgi:hypothetical protein
MTSMKRMLDIDEALGTIGLMRKSEFGGVGSFLFGLGVGIVGGCAAALLLTPYSGTEARQKLIRASEDLSKTVQGKVGEVARGFNQQTQGQFGTGTRIGS